MSVHESCVTFSCFNLNSRLMAQFCPKPLACCAGWECRAPKSCYEVQKSSPAHAGVSTDFISQHAAGRAGKCCTSTSSLSEEDAAGTRFYRRARQEDFSGSPDSQERRQHYIMPSPYARATLEAQPSIPTPTTAAGSQECPYRSSSGW